MKKGRGGGKKIFHLLAVILLISCSAQARGFFFPNVDINYKVLDNGTVLAKERLTFSFSGSYTFAYRDLPQGWWQYSNIKVYEYKDGIEVPVASSQSFNGDNIRVRWGYSASNGRKTFVIRYSVSRAIKSYDDAYDFYWKIWGEGWDATVSRMRATITFPRSFYRGSRVWIHAYAQYDYNLTGNILTVDANNIPARSFVEFRLLFNKEALKGGDTLSTPGNGYQKAVDEENRNEREQEAKSSLWSWLWLWSVVAAAALGLGFYYCYDKYGREPRPSRIAATSDIPATTNPWEVEYIMTQGVTVKSMTATLLDLARGGYVKIEKIRASGLLGLLGRDDYKLSLTKKFEAHQTELHQLERWLLKQVFKGGPKWSWQNAFSVFSSADPDEPLEEDVVKEITLSQVRINHSKDCDSIAHRWTGRCIAEIYRKDGFLSKNLDFSGRKAFGRILMVVIDLTALVFACVFQNLVTLGIFAISIIATLLLWKQPFKPMQVKITFSMIPAIFLIYFFYWLFTTILKARPIIPIVSNFYYWSSAFFVNALPMILTAIPIIAFAAIENLKPFALSRFSIEGLRRFEECAGLEKFLDDMGNFREKLPTQIVVWEQYLVYATIFGNAEKVAKDMEALNVLPRTYSGFACAASSPGFSSSFSSGFSSASTASAHGSGGGGGRGGGGGGGGGGGAG